MALWPNKGEADPRPELGAAYARVAPVAPKHPVVPDAAPGALRLPSSTSGCPNWSRPRAVTRAVAGSGPGSRDLPPRAVPAPPRRTTSHDRSAIEWPDAGSRPGSATLGMRPSPERSSPRRLPPVSNPTTCPRRRLRRPVRPADRPPRPRGAGLLRDRPARRCRSPRCWPRTRRRSSSPAGPSACTRRAPRGRRRPVRRRGPGVRHLLRLPGDGPGARRRGRADRA